MLSSGQLLSFKYGLGKVEEAKTAVKSYAEL